MNVDENVEGDPVTATNKKIHKVLDSIIRKKEKDKKLAELPLHQTTSIGEQPHKRTTSVPGRPIISNKVQHGNISTFLDFHLKSSVTRVPHILEDTRSTVTKFSLRFNQYKSNIILYGEGKGKVNGIKRKVNRIFFTFFAQITVELTKIFPFK